MTGSDRTDGAASPAARAKSLFLAAAEIDDPRRRAEFLDDACRGDSDLRRQVDMLLAAADGSIAQQLDRGIAADDFQTAGAGAVSPRSPSAFAFRDHSSRPARVYRKHTRCPRRVATNRS